MSQILPFIYFNQVRTLDTSKSIPDYLRTLSVNRAPTDPYFYANVTIQNCINGSRYWLVNNDDYSQVLSTGIVNTDPYTISSVPAYGSPFTMLLRIRNSSGSPKYKTFETIIIHSKTGATVYVIQELDE